MKVKMISRRILALFIAAAGIAVGVLACMEHSPVDTIVDPDNTHVLVRLDIRIPGNSVPQVRALQEEHENEVAEIIVLAFEKGADTDWDTRLRHVGRSVGMPLGRGSTKRFTVELYSGEWDLWVLANSAALMEGLQEKYEDTDIYSPEFIELGLKKSDLQADVTKTISGKWNVDPEDPDSNYRMPMWGMLDAVQVQTSSTDRIGTVNLYRMLVKIDVEVQRTEDAENPEMYPGIPLSQFELTHVSLHNYNTVGRLIPGITAEDGSWTNVNGGIALKTSLPANPGSVYGWESSNRLEWSDEGDFTEEATALEGMIYTLEADAGTFGGDRPCIIIGGKYEGSSELTYYRADFLDKNKKYLKLLRNHNYKFVVRKIGGQGFPSVKDAYEAGPTNLEAEVIEWNEGDYLEGVWNETYEIRFSGRNVHFSQFGKPSPQQIKLITNVPTLSFGDFANITAAPADNVWAEGNPGEWSNDHFDVVIAKTATMGEYSEYTITVTADTTRVGDPARNSIFYAEGYMLRVGIEITQDYHVVYRLLTSPDPMNPIAVDGMLQRVKINITSTHPYRIDLMEYDDMFSGVYAVAAGGNPMDLSEIPKNMTEVYVEITEHEVSEARVGEFYIQHTDPLSDTPARVYSVLQITPVLTAELEGGGLLAQVSRRGGDKTIKVNSNLSGWYPILYIDGDLYEGDPLAYFNMTTGVKTQDIRFSVPVLPGGTTTDREYKIMFRDLNNATETRTFITITQKAMNGTPPTGGTNAPECVLAVDANGELNLDGRGYIVFFKWGSTVAISGAATNFDASQIAWAPDGYDISAIGNDWGKVPFADGTVYPSSLPPNLPAFGLGDPCELASKDGDVGRWKMPTTSTFAEVRTGITDWTTRLIQGVNVLGRAGTTVFYPAAGLRSSGRLNEVDQTGCYWSAEAGGTSTAKSLHFTSGSVMTGYPGGRALGYAIRCIPK